MTVRVLVEYRPNLLGFLGLVPVEQCIPAITLTDRHGERRDFYRARVTDRWVLYRAT